MSRLRDLVCAVAVTAGALPAVGLAAIDLDLSARDIEAVLAIARGPEAGRAAFHAPYLLPAPDPVVERIEVIPERRRVALLAAERIALGDPLFTRGTLRGGGGAAVAPPVTSSTRVCRGWR